MKKLLLLSLFVSTLSANTPEIFRVSQVRGDKTKLISVFNGLNQAMREARADYEGILVVQRISDTQFHVYGVNSPNARYPRINDEKRYFLETSRPMRLADGETVADFPIYESGELYEYETATGARATLRVAKEVPSQMISKDDFVKRLRNGERFAIPDFEEADCRNCFGRGQLGKLQGNERCPECRGEGTLLVDCIVIW